jgi:hypothetical protein
METVFPDTRHFHSNIFFGQRSQQLQCKAAGGKRKECGDWGPFGISNPLRFASIIR